jgi:hypothetical protein
MNPKALPIPNKENLSNLTNSIKGSLGKSVGNITNRFTNFVGGFGKVFKGKDAISSEDNSKKSSFGGLKGLFGISKKSTTIFSTLKELSASTTSIKENVQKYIDIVDGNEETKREEKTKDDEFKAEVKNYLDSILKALGGKKTNKNKEESGGGFLSGLLGLLGLTGAGKFLQKMLGNFFKRTGMLIWEGISKYIISPLKNLISKALASTKNLISRFLRWSAEKIGISATAKTAEALTKTGAEKTAEAVVKTGTEKTTKALVKAGTEKTAETITKEGAEKVTETATKKGIEQVGETAVKEGAEKTAEVTTKAISEQAAEVTTKQAAETVTKTGAEAAIKGTTEAAVKGTTEAAVKETAEVTAKGATRGVSKAAGVIAAPIVETAFAVYDYNQESAKLDELEKEGLITAKEKEGRLNRLKGEKTGSAVGGTVGGIAGGAAVGAAIGSIVPGVGTLIGGLVGGIVGGIAGNMAGEAAGGAITDATSENVLTDEELQKRVEERRLKKEQEVLAKTPVEPPKVDSIESASAPKDLQDVKDATLKDTVAPQQTNIVVNNVQGGTSTNVNNVNKAAPQENSVNVDNILANATAGDLAETMP